MNQADSNIDSVTRALSGIVDGKLDEVRGQLDDSPKWNVAAGLSEAGLYEGKPDIMRMLGARRERFHGGYKLAHLTVHGTNAAVFAEYTRTSADGAMREHCLAVFEMVVGKIREVREFVFRT